MQNKWRWTREKTLNSKYNRCDINIIISKDFQIVWMTKILFYE